MRKSEFSAAPRRIARLMRAGYRPGLEVAPAASDASIARALAPISSADPLI